jgi:hypothetical protein
MISEEPQDEIIVPEEEVSVQRAGNKRRFYDNQHNNPI